LVFVLMTSCVGKEVRKNPCLTTPWNATRVDNGGSANLCPAIPRNGACANKGVCENPCTTKPRNATCVGKGGSESLRRDITQCYMYKQEREGKYPACDIWRGYEATAVENDDL